MTSRWIAGLAIALIVFGPRTSAAQLLTTATITGSVKDAQGGVLPGVTITLTSESKGTAVPAVVTEANGEFVVANLAPDTYRMQIMLQGFKTVDRRGLAVSGGDRLSLGVLTLEVGALNETITVTGEAPLVQTTSGERSFTVPTQLVENLPISTNRSFTMLAGLAPGTTAALGGNVNAGIQPQRIGGGGPANIMMDGVSTMDIASNRPTLQMNVESIGEVKVVSSSYQAEYGRSSGVQVIAVTKSGTNQFRGSVYDVERNSQWNANSRVNVLNGDPKPSIRERDWGYSIGGPIGKPGASNRLFFFYAQEFAPRSNGGSVVRFRVPTALERQGDFSQSIDNNGNVYNLIRDASTGLPCTAANTSGCFQSGGAIGRIPANRLYPTGLNLLSEWPMPNVNVPGAAYNYQATLPTDKELAWQPALRVDYNVSERIRASFKYSGWQQKVKTIIGTLPGYNDSVLAHPKVDTWAANGNWALNSTTFAEVTYGRSRQPQSGCALATQGTAPIYCATGFPADDVANPANIGLSALPLIFPNSGAFDPRYLATKLLQQAHTPVYQNNQVLIAPTFVWGNRVANAPPNTPFPGSGNLNGSYETNINGSVTKELTAHTIKTGVYWAHAIKYQPNAAGSGPVFGTARGNLSFANNTSNPLDSTFGFANAALGIYNTYQQLSGWFEGANGFKNLEMYAQDTWRMTNKFTLNYGLRVVRQTPQYDELLQGSNFLPDRWSAASAPLLYAAGCANNVYPCTGDTRQAMDPRTGAFLGTGTAALIGAVIPNTGDPYNGIVSVKGTNLPKEGYTMPKLGWAPRIGFAYDVNGKQRMVLRGGGGLFYTRGFGNYLVGNPPLTQDVTLQFGTLQSLANAVASTPRPGPQVLGWQFDSPYPTDAQWSGGTQITLPFETVLDAAYVGHHSWNEVYPLQMGAIDVGSAFLPQNQDRTLAASATPGATAVVTQLMAPLRGYNNVWMTTNLGWRTYHGVQLSVQHRLSHGVQFGLNDTITLSDRGFCASGSCPSTQVLRMQHNADGTYVVRSDQAQQDKLLGNMLTPRHIFKGTFLWMLPNAPGGGEIIKALLNSWQVAGVWTAATGTPYAVTYSYSSGGSNINLTGSPDYAGRVRVVGDPGSGCSSDPVRQFTTSAFQGPISPSLGLESGNNYLHGCFQSAFDTSISRQIHLGGNKTIQLRADIFNLLNQGIVTARNTTMQLNNPNDPVTIANLPVDANGNVIAARAKPNGAGLGTATTFQTPRTVQLQIRFGF